MTNKLKKKEFVFINNSNIVHSDMPVKKSKTNFYFTIVSEYVIYGGKVVIKIIQIVVQVSGIYLMWILLHYFASQLYVKLCTPSNFVGLLLSPFLTSTPYCQGLRWMIYNGAGMINNMWIVIATWFCANIFILNNNASVSNT